MRLDLVNELASFWSFKVRVSLTDDYARSMLEDFLVKFKRSISQNQTRRQT